MNIFSAIFTVLGLSLFETICSIDNAVINAGVLAKMSAWARRWFLFWGILFAVFVIRGVLPWLIVWCTVPKLGPIGAFTATFSSDPKVLAAIEESAPVLLMGGGLFLVLLFLHWLFLENKNFGLPAEKFFRAQGGWFYPVTLLLLGFIAWLTLPESPAMAISAAVGAAVFFITHGFKASAEHKEEQLLNSPAADISKLVYLEVIDASFSIDGVLGAFAFTLSVPLILLGNGLGAFVVRQLTIYSVERINRYVYLKNGAMYSIMFLGTFMILKSFSLHIPEWASPLSTFTVIGFFFLKSRRKLRNS